MGKKINTILNLTDKFTPKLTEAGKQALIFEERLKNFNRASNSIDRGLSKAAKTAVAFGAAGAAAVTAFTTSSLNTYKDFQQSMSNVAGILAIDNTSETYKKLEDAAREAGAKTSKNAQESADALSYMALAGWSVEDSMKGLMPILRASEATGADLATTSDLITDSMSALGVQVNDLNSYLDICARAQNKSNTTLTQMQEAYIKCGGTFKTFNTELPESAALLGVLANRGIKGSEAGTKLQSTLVNLTKKSGESYKAMSALGISAYDSEGKFKGVTETLLELNEKTKNLTEEQRNNYLTMIGGKEQLTTLNALMSGLTNILEDGRTEYEALFAEVSNADGALEKMATTMTNNYAGALEQASGALDELKLTLGERLAPYATRFMNWFADSLPEATEKFAVWLDSKIPKAINFFKSAFEKAKPVVTFFIDNFQELAVAGLGVIAGLKGFTIVTRVVSFLNKLKGTMQGLTTAQKLATIATTGFNTSLLASPISWLTIGIGAAAGGVLAWRKHLEEADIEKHFGDITLSAEECSEIVKGVFGESFLSQIDSVNSAAADFEQSLENTADAAKKLDKLNFQIQFGSDISEEDYLAAVEEYVESLQATIDDRQYSLSLDIDLLFGGSEFGEAFGNDTNEYYGELSQQAAQLGEKLKEAAKSAYENNWDLDSTEAVAAILKQQNEIQTKIATAKSEAKLEALSYDFVTGDLSKESFENLINATNEELDNLKNAYNESRINSIAQARLMYGADTPEYENALKKANESYNEKAGSLFAKGQSFLNNSIMSAYPEIGEAFKKVNLNDYFWEETSPEQGESQEQYIKRRAKNFYWSLSDAFRDVPMETRNNVGKFYEMMMPNIEELDSIFKNMEKVPDEMANVFMQANAIGTFGNRTGAPERFITDALSTVFSSGDNAILEGTSRYGEYFHKGIASDSNKASIENGAEELINLLENTLSKPITVNPTIRYNVTAGPIPNQIPSFLSGVDNNATGTTYFGGGFTTINEHGYEVVDLPQGSRIYPHSESEKMMNGGKNINVSVNVYGNMYGSENAANEIGEIIVGRILGAIGAV